MIIKLFVVFSCYLVVVPFLHVYLSFLEKFILSAKICVCHLLLTDISNASWMKFFCRLI